MTIDDVKPRNFLIWLFPGLVIFVTGGIYFLLSPPPQTNIISTRILDRHGSVLYEIRPDSSGSNRYLAIDKIPQPVIDVLINTEDRTFYLHPGVSARGVIRAAWQNFKAGRVISGGSTITQQLARNRLHPENRTLGYKVLEAVLALKLDLVFSKHKILEEYLNTAYFGHQAYGIAAAAQVYFGKTVPELSLSETALLIGLLQSPSVLDPYINFAGAKKRQETVLKSLITNDDQFLQLASDPITLAPDKVSIKAPHFVFWLLNQYQQKIDNQPEVITTLDLNLQTEAESIIAYHLKKLADNNVTSAAVVVLDAKNGDLLAMVGSGNYFDQSGGAVNVADSPRQPGSSLKPFAYALALADGDTLATTVSDTQVQFFTEDGFPYTPRNYDFLYHGLVRYREALANSYNIPAVKVLEKTGVERLLDILRSAGITTLNKEPEYYGLALTLGSGEVKLLELTRAYGIFVNGGKIFNYRALKDQLTKEGRQILDEKTAWLITDVLSDKEARLPEFGEDNPLNFDYAVAAKTGTTRNNRDNWVIGYSSERLVGVWVGNADNSPMRGTSGITGAGPIFHDVMNAANRNILKQAFFAKPGGINKKTVCRLSGKLPTEYCSHVIDEYFIAGTEPQEPDDIYQPVKIDKRNQLLAAGNCDEDFVYTKIFAVFPSELKKWAQENGWEQPPTEISPLCKNSHINQETDNDNFLIITRPHNGDSFLLDPLVPDASEMIIFNARGGSQILSADWLIDNQVISTSKAPDFRFKWFPSPGWHTIKIKSGREEDEINIEVRK